MKNNQQRWRPQCFPYLSVSMAIVLTLILSACSSGLAVRSDTDPTADFAAFTTFNFFEPMGKVTMRSYTAPYVTGGYYGRPGGYYAGSAMGVGVSAGSRAIKTTEASVFIDFVDFKNHRVVWQGVTVVNVNDKVALQLRDAIFTSVNRVMAEYPHTAGS